MCPCQWLLLLYSKINHPTRYMLFRNPQGCNALAALRLLQLQTLGFLSHIDPLNSVSNYFSSSSVQGWIKNQEAYIYKYSLESNMYIKLLATDSKLSLDRNHRSGCAQPSMHVYSAKCKGQGLQLSPCMEVLPNISVHRYGNDSTVSKHLLKCRTWMAGLTLVSDDSGSLATL